MTNRMIGLYGLSIVLGPDIMHNAAFHWGLHCLLLSKQPSGTEVHLYLENFTHDPLKYTMGSPIHIV